MPPLNRMPYEEGTGPAARQRAFVEQRLAGAALATPPNSTRAVAHATDPGLTDPGASERGDATTLDTTGAASTPPAGAEQNLAEIRCHQLTAFRTRQLEQSLFLEIGPAQPPGPLAAASRGMEIPDFVETNRWTLIGPTVVREGQSGKQPAMSGRVRGIAVAPGGQRVYIASANGGVWRSEDGGQSWLSLMDAFDLNPTLYRADSLACGALALVPGNWAGQDLIFVGSGEPGVVPWFQGDSAYFGVGPIVSTDGGLTWLTEPSEPTLAGRAFYALAIDPIGHSALLPPRSRASTAVSPMRRAPIAGCVK